MTGESRGSFFAVAVDFDTRWDLAMQLTEPKAGFGNVVFQGPSEVKLSKLI